MNAPQALPTLGTAMGGGFYAGSIAIAGKAYSLIVAPKAEGEHEPTIWIPDYKDVPGAKAYDDGLANTRAMAKAGSQLAQWALGLRIGGFDDWHIPSQDELELCYRAFKPTTEENWLYARSGINLSALPPTRPYTAESPLQTSVQDFQKDGAEAFAANWYWSSTQRAGDSDSAWCQCFNDGDQYWIDKGIKLRARAVRRLAI